MELEKAHNDFLQICHFKQVGLYKDKVILKENLQN